MTISLPTVKLNSLLSINRSCSGSDLTPSKVKFLLNEKKSNNGLEADKMKKCEALSVHFFFRT